MGKLDGKSIVITGCSGGIGRETAIKFAEEGAKLSICARSTDKLMETKKMCEQRGAETLAFTCDVTDKGQLEEFVKQTVDRFGGIDVLINNAVNAKPGSPFMEQTEEYLQTVFESGFLAVWRLMKLCFPYLKESEGTVINYGSASGITGAEGFAAYGSIKEAIRGFTKIMATEWGKYNIKVNCIAPTAITPNIQAYIDQYPEGERSPEKLGYTLPPLGRVGTAYEDIAPILVFLASDDSNYMTGQTIRADGGLTIF